MEKKLTQKGIIILCWIVYASAYLCRYSYSSNITLIIHHYNITRAAAGLVTTCFFFAYGGGQIINGLLSKYYNKKYIIFVALLLSVIINFIIFLGVPFEIIKYLWLLNGLIQSVLWSSLMLLLAEVLIDGNTKKAVMIMATAPPIGLLMSFLFSSIFALTNHFKYAFLFGAVVVFVISFVWLLLYNKFTIKYDNTSNIVENKSDIHDENPSKYKMAPIMIIIFVVLALFGILTNIVKGGFDTWTSSILKESFNISDSLSIFLTLFLPFVSIFGSAIVVNLNKKITNYITLLGVMYLMAIPFIVITGIFIKTSVIIVIICLASISLLMTGANTVFISLYPLQTRQYMNSGRTAGILNGFCYVGTTISSYGLGKIVDITGNWINVFHIFFWLLIVAMIISFVLTIISHKKNHKK